MRGVFKAYGVFSKRMRFFYVICCMELVHDYEIFCSFDKVFMN